MTYKMNPKQFESVVSLPARERYNHFISKCADWEEVWSLRNDEGFVSMSDDDGQACIPFWPHPEYANAFATGIWSDCKSVCLQLEEFITDWVDGLNRDKVKMAIFPITGEKGIIVAPDQVKNDFEIECEQYE